MFVCLVQTGKHSLTLGLRQATPSTRNDLLKNVVAAVVGVVRTISLFQRGLSPHLSDREHSDWWGWSGRSLTPLEPQETPFSERLERVINICGTVLVARVAGVQRSSLVSQRTRKRSTRVALSGAVAWLEEQIIATNADKRLIRDAMMKREIRQATLHTSATDDTPAVLLEYRLQPRVLATSQTEWSQLTGLPLSVRASIVGFRGDVGPDKIRQVANVLGVA